MAAVTKRAKPAKSLDKPAPGGMAALVRLIELVDRIAANQGADTYFSEAEVARWPVDLVKALKASRLLAQASPADEVECPGCEEACVMPVHVVRGTGSLPDRAIVSCDKRDDIARVDIPLTNLGRMKSSGSMLADSLAGILFADLARPIALDGQRWQLGQFAGLKHKSPLVLSLDRMACLALAGHSVNLADVMLFGKGGLGLDLPALRKLADNPTGLAVKATESLDDRAKRVYDRINELKSQGRKPFVKPVADELGLSEATIKNDYKKHADSLKRRKPGASVFDQANPAISSRKSKRQY